MHGSLQLQPVQSSLRYSRIIALDLGKFNSVLCNYDPATAGHAFVSLTTDRQTIRRPPPPHRSRIVWAG